MADASRDWSIQEIARLAGTTSRTLRHYDDIGLLPPSRIGTNGYRYYDRFALVRLQRVLLLRELGLGLPAIAEVLANERDAPSALAGHLAWLREEQARLARQIASVETTIDALREGREIMAHDMLDGFEHTEYKAEVEERWGSDAYAEGDAWWRAMSADQRADWQAARRRLADEWTAAANRGAAPDGDEALALARRHVEWLRAIPGTPGAGTEPSTAYIIGLGELYAARTL